VTSELIAFRRLAPDDIPRLVAWSRQAHVRQWYSLDLSPEEMRAKYGPRARDDSPVRAWIILVDGREAGYLQSYALASFPDYQAKIGEGRLAGLDLFIGEPDLVNRGLGPRIIRRFVDEQVFARGEFDGCVAGPNPANRASIRAFHKAGFRSWKRIRTDVEEEQVVRIDRESGSVRCVLFDWGGTLMSEDGPLDIPMGLWPEVRAIDGAVDTLAQLALTHRIAVATNATVSSRDMIERALDRAELFQHVTDIFCFTEIGARKESSRFWTQVLEELGMSAREVVMVGDTLEPDVIGPRSFGIPAIWFNESGREANVPTGVPVVTSLVEVIPLIREGRVLA
jgi:RimJ/RimL family protein N-acetyltransferase